jgi:ankyrin repeat protein
MENSSKKPSSPKKLKKICSIYLANNTQEGAERLPTDLKEKIQKEKQLLNIEKKSNNDPKKALFLAIKKDYALTIKKFVKLEREAHQKHFDRMQLNENNELRSVANALGLSTSKFKTPIEYAISKNRLNITKQLIDYGATAQNFALKYAAINADDKMIKLLVDEKIFDTKKSTTNAFMIAAASGNIKACQALLQLTTVNIAGLSPLKESGISCAIQYATDNNKPHFLRSFCSLLEKIEIYQFYKKHLLEESQISYKNKGFFKSSTIYVSPIEYAERNKKHEIVTIIKEHAQSKFINDIRGIL